MRTLTSALEASRVRFLTIGMIAAGFVLGGPGCKSSPAPDSKSEPKATAQEEEQDGEAEEVSQPEKHAKKKPGEKRDRQRAGARGGGPETMFHVALDNLELTEVQKTAIESARTSLRETKRPDRPHAFAILAKAVREGKVDEKAVQAEIDKSANGGEDGRERMTAALEKLHTTLTPDQRRQLVNILLERIEEKGSNNLQDRANRPGRSALDFALRGVTLSAEQRTKIDDALAKAGLDGSDDKPKTSFVTKRKAALEAFAKDKFDADAVLPPEDDRGPAAQVPRMIKALAIVVPMLDENQRKELADKLEHPRADKQTRRDSNR